MTVRTFQIQPAHTIPLRPTPSPSNYIVLLSIFPFHLLSFLCCSFCVRVHAQLLKHVRLFLTPWIAALQALCPWNSPGKNTGVRCHFLLQRIFPTQGSNSCLLHWQETSLPTVPLGKPLFLWYPLPKNPSVVVSTTIFEIPTLTIHISRDRIFPSYFYLQ